MSRRVFEVTTAGGKFPWRSLDDALWHVEFMRKWGARLGKRERVTLRIFSTDKD
jgi:hypothetical protein